MASIISRCRWLACWSMRSKIVCVLAVVWLIRACGPSAVAVMRLFVMRPCHQAMAVN
jgi:hypothetical protein